MAIVFGISLYILFLLGSLTLSTLIATFSSSWGERSFFRVSAFILEAILILVLIGKIRIGEFKNSKVFLGLAIINPLSLAIFN